MDPNDFEFLLSQYLDGTLPADRRQLVEHRLSADPGAKAILEQYRKLNQIVAADSPALDAVRWDRLAENISDAVAERNSTPIFSFRWVSSAAAIAAMLLVIIGIWKVYFQPPPGSHPEEVAMDVSIPEIAQPADMVVDVSVGRPQDAAVIAKYQSLSTDKPVINLVGLSNTSR